MDKNWCEGSNDAAGSEGLCTAEMYDGCSCAGAGGMTKGKCRIVGVGRIRMGYVQLGTVMAARVNVEGGEEVAGFWRGYNCAVLTAGVIPGHERSQLNQEYV